MEQGCPHRSILPHIFPDCNSLAIKIGGKFCGVRGVPRWGGLPRRCRRGGRQAGVSGTRRGSLPALSPANPAFSLLFRPYPGGKGVTIGYFMQGAAPLASPGLNPRGTGSPCRCGKLNGGACPSVVGAAGVSGTQRGACRFWSPANPAFRFLFCPYPPSPLPGGKGVTIGYFMQGAAPRASPGLNPRGTGSPCHCGKLNGGACPGVAGAAGVSDTRRGACLLCRLPALPLRCPRGACPLCRLLTLPLTCFLAPIPRPPSRREGG